MVERQDVIITVMACNGGGTCPWSEERLKRTKASIYYYYTMHAFTYAINPLNPGICHDELLVGSM
jgi:hypothetical protein